MATWTTYGEDTELEGMAEDVSDIISNISPTETPFQTLINKESCYARNPEWQEDELRAADATNAAVEGADATENAPTETTMRQNYTQILQETVKVSRTADTVRTYGRARELSYQLSKAGASLKRDLEAVMVGADTAADLGTVSTGRKMASYTQQIDAATTEAGGLAALDETKVLNLMEKIYNEGGSFSVIMCKPSDSLIIANFTTSTGRERDFGNEMRLVNVVNLYVSPFGEASVILNRFQLVDHCLIFDPDMWSLLTLDPWTRNTLAKMGDNTKTQIVGEFSLKHRNQKASGMINALT